jgi:hypothetical protein
MLSITCEIAQRLEAAEAADGADCAEAQCLLEPEGDAAVKAIAGGFLIYVGAGSPLTHALGIGLHGPVTAADLDEIEEFYISRDAPVVLDVCPYSDPTLIELLNTREYRVAEFANVLVRPIQPGEVLDGATSAIEVRPAHPSEAEVWSATDVCGFFGREALSDEERRLGRILFHMPRATPMLALIEGEPAGAGCLSLRAGVASCFADATLVRFRRRGVHNALIRERLRMAAVAGCDLITAGTQPGSGSQRDYERFGFQVAYTKVTMTR